MITVPQLDPVQHLDPTDVIIITHANGTSEKITGADFLKGVTPVDNITARDMHPVTSNAVAAIAPVGTIAEDNLHSVTSDAVFKNNKTTAATITKAPNVINGNNFYASRSANVVQISINGDSGCNIPNGVITRVATVSPKPKMFTELSCQCDMVLVDGKYVAPYQRMYIDTYGEVYIFVAYAGSQNYTANVFAGGCYLV